MSLSEAITSIDLLSDSDDDSTPGPPPSVSVPDVAPKPRNIAVKKGAPAQPQRLQPPPQRQQVPTQPVRQPQLVRPPQPQSVRHPQPQIVRPPQPQHVRQPLPQNRQQQQPQQNMQFQPEYMKGKGIKGLLEGSKFLADFNPENSRREKNKRHNLVKPQKQPMKNRSTQSMYDEQGRLRFNKADVCDCFDSDCPGCHFECEQCGSQKCGLRCRVNRRWAFESIEHDGKDQIKTNTLLTTINFRN